MDRGLDPISSSKSALRRANRRARIRWLAGNASLGLGARGFGGAKSRSGNQQSHAELEETLKDRWSRGYDVYRSQRLEAREKQLAQNIAMEKQSGRTVMFEQQVAELAADIPTKIVRQVENPYTRQVEELTITWTYNRARVQVHVKGPKGTEADGFGFGDPLAREVDREALLPEPPPRPEFWTRGRSSTTCANHFMAEDVFARETRLEAQ